MQGLSIIFVTYNCNGLFNSSLSSVCKMAQIIGKFSAVELIISDDDSCDGTLESCKDFLTSKFPRLEAKIICSPSNSGGPAFPRNHGIANARYNYVMFFDAGDVVVNMEIAEHARQTMKLGYHLIGFGREGQQSSQRPVNKLDVRLLDTKEIATRNPITLSGSLVSRAFLEKNKLKFCEKLKFVGVEDYDLWIRISRVSNARIGMIAGNFISYERTVGGLSSSGFKRLKPHWRVLSQNFSFSCAMVYFVARSTVGVYNRVFSR